jgi:UDP-N-acetylmuramyl pentapeptide phosphotransferase/UDP-N-acetylglucosamine-1-phosphate transferase
MDFSAVDFPALGLALIIALTITVALMRADPGGNRRGWITAAVVAGVLFAVLLADLLRETPRQTHVATAIVGAIVPVLGALGMVRATRRVRPLFRWSLVYVTALILLLAGLLLGATFVARFFS